MLEVEPLPTNATSTTPAVIRIVGIDPGSRVTGYGIVDSHRNRLAHVASGVVRVHGETLAERLACIFAALGALLVEHEPAEMAVEQVFVHRNVSSALKLGHARGAALLAGVNGGLDVHEYMPNQVKQAVTGRGHADKTQVQHMVRVLLGLAESPMEDAADALAVAICHAHVRETGARREAAARLAETAR